MRQCAASRPRAAGHAHSDPPQPGARRRCAHFRGGPALARLAGPGVVCRPGCRHRVLLSVAGQLRPASRGDPQQPPPRPDDQRLAGDADGPVLPRSVQHDPYDSPGTSPAQPHRLRDVRPVLSHRQPIAEIRAVVLHPVRPLLSDHPAGGGADRGLPRLASHPGVPAGSLVELPARGHPRRRGPRLSGSRCCSSSRPSPSSPGCSDCGW